MKKKKGFYEQSFENRHNVCLELSIDFYKGKFVTNFRLGKFWFHIYSRGKSFSIKASLLSFCFIRDDLKDKWRFSPYDFDFLFIPGIVRCIIDVVKGKAEGEG